HLPAAGRARSALRGAGVSHRRLPALEPARRLHARRAALKRSALSVSCVYDPYAPIHLAVRCGKVTKMAVTRAIELRTEIPGPRSREILERKAKVVADPLSVFLPIVAEEGHGATITDGDGNTFIDFTCA